MKRHIRWATLPWEQLPAPRVECGRRASDQDMERAEYLRLWTVHTARKTAGEIPTTEPVPGVCQGCASRISWRASWDRDPFDALRMFGERHSIAVTPENAQALAELRSLEDLLRENADRFPDMVRRHAAMIALTVGGPGAY